MSIPERPGWYPDPDGSAGERWFNGISWSDSKRTVGGKSFTAPLPPPPGNANRAWNKAREAVSSRPDPYAIARQNPLPGQQFSGARVVDLSQNRFATIALVLGVVSLFFGLLAIPAIIVALIALNRARALPQETSGKPFALVGLTLGVIGLVLGVVPVIIGVATFVELFR